MLAFEGNDQEYETGRHKRLGAAADMPHRIKYRKLTTSRSGRGRPRPIVSIHTVNGPPFYS